MNIRTAVSMIEQAAGVEPEKTAFVERDGSIHNFGQLLEHVRFIGAQLLSCAGAGRCAAIFGEIDYGGVCAMLGCMVAGCPLIPLSAGLSEGELVSLIGDYEVGVLFANSKHAELTAALSSRMPDLTILTDIGLQLSREPADFEIRLPDVDPDAPAFLFRTAEGGGVMVSHQNICSALAALTSSLDISSYTFLCPMNWGEAFDCTVGVLLPLTAGCTLIRRGEKKGVSRAIAESGATALTCTNQRLRSLERSLRFRSEQNLGKAAIAMYGVFDRMSRALRLDLRKRMHKRVRRLLGDKLRLIICGGNWPERDSAQRFADWGMEVLSCYFTPECGPMAISDLSGQKLRPLAELTVPFPISDGLGELYAGGNRVPLGFYNGKALFPSGFPTGDVGLITEDGELVLRGRRRSMLYGRDGQPIFPEELSQIVKKSRYVSDCSITGRFDTKTADIILTAKITPDLREVRNVIGENYSDNRLRLFFRRVMEKLESELPRKINEFKVLS